jgi:glycosyltransferase involved in cell wall biosynthesis
MAGIDKLMVLPNGVDVQAWRPDTHVRNAMRREALLDGEFLWLAAGRLEPVKDYPTLLAAMARAPQPSRLIVAGCGPLKDELLRLTAQLGLESRVRFLGFEEDLRPWMQAADGFVLSSHWEGLPIALLEAAACAVPAVATDVPGTREALLQGQTGFLAQAGDAPSLCQAMTAVMRLPLAERRAMGEQARQAVTERYSLKVVLDRWEALYQELLGQNPRPLRWGKSA